jgi:hypothetical protein
LEKNCRNVLFFMPGLIVLGAGLIALGIALVALPTVVLSTPKIKKGLKDVNKWRKDSGLKTHKEFKKELEKDSDSEN